MNICEHLILIRGEDKTKQISACRYENGYWHVTFNESNQIYEYRYPYVQWLRSPQIIDPAAYPRHDFVVGDEHLVGVVQIYRFNDYVRFLFRSGVSKLYLHKQVRMVEKKAHNPHAKQVLSYLNQLTELISLKDEDDVRLLSQIYSSLKVKHDSVLSLWLTQSDLITRGDTQQPLFPFGFNLSQKQATERALIEKISVIEGPPGTGKTQTILNIIANAVLLGKTVAVVSNNNTAILNVLEKLQKNNVGWIAAMLGNRDNKEQFIHNQTGEYPDFSGWSLTEEEEADVRQSYVECTQSLTSMLSLQNELAELYQQLSALETEAEHFKQYNRESNALDDGHEKQVAKAAARGSSALLRLLIEYQLQVSRGQKLVWWRALWFRWRHGMWPSAFEDHNRESMIAGLQRSYYLLKTEELRTKIESMEQSLAAVDAPSLMVRSTELSMRLFRSSLGKRFGSGLPPDRRVYTMSEIRRCSQEFQREYPIILSTTHSLRSSLGEDKLFDYVIVDEASQVDIVTGALALSVAKQAVIVGDRLQLSHVVPSEVSEQVTQLFGQYELADGYDYNRYSLLTSVLQIWPNMCVTLLREHYRCHPKIIGFCNQKFYRNELIVMTREQDGDTPLVLYKTSKGHHARGMYNQRQIDVILGEVFTQQGVDVHDGSVGIISPYRQQVSELNRVLEADAAVEVDTVHKYQGREKDVVILSTVANQVAVNDFVDQANLINVAVSRAVKKLIVIVSEGAEEWHGTNLGDLVRYMQYHNFEVIESRVYSVFDLLYSSFSQELLLLMQDTKNVSAFQSENLANNLIERVLSEPAFSHLERVLHQPLKMLIRNPNRLTEEECKFAMNSLTHTDFVIFNKLDKMPVLVIEVDGYAYHQRNPEQLRRDRMKDEILRKYEIPMLRLSTVESGEEERIRRALI